MSAVDNCFRPKRDNLMQPIHLQFSQKFKAFSQFFRAFSKSALNFEHFQKRDDLIAYLFLTLRPAKNVVRHMCKKSRFRLPSQKEHAKRVSTLFKSERENVQHICCAMGSEFSGKKPLLVI